MSWPRTLTPKIGKQPAGLQVRKAFSPDKGVPNDEPNFAEKSCPVLYLGERSQAAPAESSRQLESYPQVGNRFPHVGNYRYVNKSAYNSRR